LTVDPSGDGRGSALGMTGWAAFVAVVLALSAVFVEEPARWLVAESPPGAADVAVVLAGDPGFERTRTAVRLWHEGQVSLLIMTGGEPGPGDSATSLRDVAVALGVPRGQIRMEQVSRSTRGAMVAVRPLLEQLQVRRVAVVTSPYHQRRACWAARRVFEGVEVVNRPAEPSSWSPEGWGRDPWSRRIVFGEYGKLVYYVLRGWA
jgi:uncharacterized SAM-binding protein YcdF (DUF218 family)